MRWACRRARRWAALAVYGELPEKELRRLEDHRRTCRDCAAFQEELAAMVGSLRAAAEDASAEGDLPDVWPRIASRLSHTPRHSITGQLQSLLPVSQGKRYGLAAAMVVVVLCGGVLIGRYLLPSADTDRIPTNANRVSDPAALEQIRRTREYLDGTRTLLLGIVNNARALRDSGSTELPAEREASVRLASEGRELRAALQGDDLELQRLLIDEIQIILLQLSALEGSGGRSGIEKVRQEVEQRSIFLKITIQDLRMMQRAGAIPGAQRL
jgi:hypothetical protein